jgi:hypothetical protein
MRFTRESSAATGLTRSSATHGVGEVVCAFEGGDGGGPSAVGVWAAPAKTAARMREKLAEYAAEGAAWPLCANILDPVRASVVCVGPGQMLEVARWFLANPSLPICKVRLRRRVRGAAASEEGGEGGRGVGRRGLTGPRLDRAALADAIMPDTTPTDVVVAGAVALDDAAVTDTVIATRSSRTRSSPAQP